MANRQSTRRVGSEAVQGEDSFVVFREMEFGTVLEAMKKGAGSTNPAEEKEFTERLFKEAVIDWNWVDDNGAPLPLPSKGLEIERLLTTEVIWLVEQITGKTQAKNLS